MADFQIKAVIAVVDKITAPIRKIGAQVREKLGGSFSALGKEVGGALSKLGDWTTAATKAAFVGGALLAAGMFEAGKSYLETAGNLADMTAQLGVSAEFLQKNRYAAKQSGIAAEDFDNSLSKLSLGMGQLRAGGGKLLGFLGGPKGVAPVLLRQVKATKSNEEAFELLMTAMDKIKDPAKRAAFAVAVFGKSGQAMTRVLADGLPAFKELREEAERTGSVLSNDAVAAGDKLGDTLDHLKASMTGVIVSIASRLVPAIQPLVDKLILWVEKNRDIIALNFEKTVDAIAKALASIDWPAVIEGAQKLAGAIKDLWDKIGGVSGATKIWAGLLTVDLLGSLAKLWPLIRAIGGVFVSVGGVIMGALGGIVSFLAIAAETIAVIMGTCAGAVVAAFTLIPIAIYEVATHLDEFAEFGREFWRTLKVLWIDGTGFLAKQFHLFTSMWAQSWKLVEQQFGPIWDGIVGVIDGAWQRIKTIVGWIVGAVGTVIDKAREVTDFLGITEAPSAPSGGPARQLAPLAFGPSASVPRGGDLANVRNGQAGGGTAEVRGGVTVRFDNAPPGMRIASTNDGGSAGLAINTVVGRRTLAAGAAL